MKSFSLNIRGRLLEYTRPVVMGIVNTTADSFYAPSRTGGNEAAERAAMMVRQGADMLDVGACSTRPGSQSVSAKKEIAALEQSLPAIRKAVGPDIPISVDTFRAEVARIAVRDLGADIVNDISGGLLDHDMIPTVSDLKAPYILMHMRGCPADMQTKTVYGESVAADVVKELSEQLALCRRSGIADVILDPGFGFSKLLAQNYELMRDLPVLDILGCPILVGISRKSMLTKLLFKSTEEALNATTALNMAALFKGASILRVHDVEQAKETVEIFCALEQKNFWL